MAAMATVSMFLSPRDSTLSVNSEVGWGALSSLQKWLGRVFVRREVTVATECPSKRRGSRRP